MGELLHSDVMGKLKISYLGGYQFICTFLDYYSKYIFTRFLKNRDEATDGCEIVLSK